MGSSPPGGGRLPFSVESVERTLKLRQVAALQGAHSLPENPLQHLTIRVTERTTPLARAICRQLEIPDP